jgi:hypothetical protein
MNIFLYKFLSYYNRMPEVNNTSQVEDAMPFQSLNPTAKELGFDEASLLQMPGVWKSFAEVMNAVVEECPRERNTLFKIRGHEEINSLLSDCISNGAFSEVQLDRCPSNLIAEIEAIWRSVIKGIEESGDAKMIKEALSGRSFYSRGRGGLLIFAVLLKWAWQKDGATKQWLALVDTIMTFLKG